MKNRKIFYLCAILISIAMVFNNLDIIAQGIFNDLQGHEHDDYCLHEPSWDLNFSTSTVPSTAEERHAFAEAAKEEHFRIYLETLEESFRQELLADAEKLASYREFVMNYTPPPRERAIEIENFNSLERTISYGEWSKPGSCSNIFGHSWGNTQTWDHGTYHYCTDIRPKQCFSSYMQYEDCQRTFCDKSRSRSVRIDLTCRP